jgi:substrate import-associated zinc metallohydrolase lipoprotein
VEAYDEVAGVEFTRSYFPKMFFLIGEWEYRNNGTFILGTAEGGKKILLSGINYIDPILQGQTSSGSMRFEFGNDVALNLNHYYIKTIHHEFVHIVNQTRPYSTEFKQITGADYVADSWSEEPHDVDFLKRGFITAYSQHSDTEDFAEMASEYIVEPEETWNKWMLEAGAEGKAKLDQKLEIVKDYYLNTWNVDLDKMRRAVHRRQADVVAGKVSLTDLTVE